MASREMVIAANRIGATLLEDNAQWTNRLQIRSETSSRLYTVAQRKASGEWGCSCPGWVRNRNCKHLKAVAPLLPKCSPASSKFGRA